VAYEAATADLRDVNMIDSFHLEAYGEMAVNYNRDLEVFPVVKRIIEKITGEESEYKSPTDKGVNRAGFGIIDDAVCREAACQEVIRRYLIAKTDYKKGKISEESVSRCKLLMDELGIKEEDRTVLPIARKTAEELAASSDEEDNIAVVALELPDGKIVTGRSSDIMVSAAAALLNGVKQISGIADEIHLISPHVLKDIQNLKCSILRHESSALSVEEVLTALTISGATNPTAEMAVQKLLDLEGCRAHCTAILSEKDEIALKSIGIDITCDPDYISKNLYFG
jgi:uncharacterized protein (UPF0371 family)